MSQVTVHATTVAEHEPENATLKQYVIGFVGSLVITLTAYTLVVNHVLSRDGVLTVVGLLAIGQFSLQLLCFLHIGKELKPRWKLYVFLVMLMVVIIFVTGSIWIMANLNAHMSTSQMMQYMTGQDGL
jgi:cytochrome o ubiquinol oxidase operon protein cyoD